MSRVDEIRAREQAATPGPWFAHESHNWHKDPPKEYFVITRGMRSVVASWAETSDAQFIAHAREDIPFLLDEIDRLTQGIRDIGRECARRFDEISRLTERVEAFERATRDFECSRVFSFACFCCVFKDTTNAHICDLLGDEVCEDMENWQFDYERFAGGKQG